MRVKNRLRLKLLVIGRRLETSAGHFFRVFYFDFVGCGTSIPATGSHYPCLQVA